MRLNGELMMTTLRKLFFWIALICPVLVSTTESAEKTLTLTQLKN